MSDGSIWRGFYPHWDELTKEEKDKVFDERKKMRADRRGGGGNPKKGNKKGCDADGGKAVKWKSELTQLKSVLKKRNRKIASLKKGGTDDSSTDSNSDGNEDAGNAFGGKRSRKNGKKRLTHWFTMCDDKNFD